MPLAQHGVDWPITAVTRKVMAGLSLGSETEELQEAAQQSRISFTAPKEPCRLIAASNLILSIHASVLEVGLTAFLKTQPQTWAQTHFGPYC